jgi:hypothetical protein
MRWLVALTTLLIAAMLISGCATGGVSSDRVTAAAGIQPLALAGVPWRDGESSAYEITDLRGRTTGKATINLARDGDVWLLTEVDKAEDQNQVVTLRIDAATLRPLSGEKSLANDTGRATLTATYEAGRVRVDGMVDDEYVGRVTDIPAGALDSDQLLMTLRALPFAEGYQGEAPVVIAQTSVTMDVTVTVKGRERVEAPIGALETWLVEMAIGQTTQRAWYEVATPYRLVKFTNGATSFALTGLVE